MTTTIGQRIKNFRKNAGLSQSELACRIGVTPQTVSKWECDVGLPDIVQIIPLAEVLDVSCDAILGADSNMEKNIEAAFGAVDEKWKDGVDNQSTDRTDMHYAFDYFTASRELFRRYPTNFEVAMCGVRRGTWLLGHIGRGLPDIKGFDEKSVLRDVERMSRAVIQYDDNVKEKIEAKLHLAIAYYSVGENAKAEEELEGLPEQSKDHAIYSATVTTGSGFDENDRIKVAKNGFKWASEEFLSWLRAIADSYSACGAPKRAETFHACEDLIAFCDRFTELCDKRTLLGYKRIGYLLTAQNHIRDGSYDKALDAIERLTDVIVEYKASIEPDAENEESIYFDRANDVSWYSKPDQIRWFNTALTWAVSDFADKTGNPVVTSERYKECLKRAEAQG